MPMPIFLQDGLGTGVSAGFKVDLKEDLPYGPVVYTEQARRKNMIVQKFVNPTLGSEMNKDSAAGGTPELIHDGTASGVWVPTANAGTWGFYDGWCCNYYGCLK